MSTLRESFGHDPVMIDEIVDVFAPVPHGVVVDATLGGAGHSTKLLERYEWMSVLGIDRDPMAIEHAMSVSSRFGERLMVQQGAFDRIPEYLAQRGIEWISGALFDLGISSTQVDRAERGFSYRSAGPLDMRMDTTQRLSAHDVVNGYDVDRLTDVIRQHSDERFARRIAQAIVAARPIQDTAALAAVVAAAIPAPARRTGGNPAKRTFQAIRIEVNNELAMLPGALEDVINATAVGGRVAVLSYHSGEDRIVKSVFAAAESRRQNDEASPFLHPSSERTFARRVRAAKRPSNGEVNRNPRAASARLRVLEKVGA
ncbi:MAG: 16S rRNA (cytosine(1402)-N(4))-methyltransferase RsmH [Ilumatobacteraceae bacterium]